MAGRGTDIKLDEEAKAAGGLKIIGTERHESRRIDNQLRGRSGRQGDVGESKFYVSLEDDLMRLFGSERLMTVFNSLGVAETDEIQHKMLSNALENAQKKIESNNFAIRKNLLEYDQVMNDQRELIYEQRRRVLAGENMKEQILNMVETDLYNAIDMCCSDEIAVDNWDLSEMNSVIREIIPFEKFDASTLDDINCVDDLKEKLLKKAYEMYEAKEAEFDDADAFREIERIVLLRVIDKKWMEEIDDMDQLRQGIGLQAYGQRNPVDEYKMASYDMVDAMNEAIRTETVQMLYRVRIEKKMEREEVAKETGTNKEESVRGPMRRKEEKIRPNSPCPCGSGKKYKFCHGRA
jgi:preprotein translocase subunit SecA